MTRNGVRKKTLTPRPETVDRQTEWRVQVPLEPTKDDETGILWWNHLTERERAYWANLAGTGRAKDAWEAFKASNGDGDRGSAA